MTTANPPALSDLHFGATVHAAEGGRVGTLHRLIVADDLSTLRDLVVSESRRSSGSIFAPGTAVLLNDVVVPMDIVQSITRERIDLSVSGDEVRALPPYIHWRYTQPSNAQVGVEAMSLMLGTGSAPAVERAFAKSRNSLEIQAGEHVMLGRGGDKLGQVRDVLFDGTSLVSVVVHPSGFFTQDVLLPVRLLDRSDDLALITTLHREDLEHLTPFEPGDD